MNLKKNDKIIAVVGVIILIVAAIGIIIYTPQDEEKPIEPTEEEMTIFNIKVDEREESITKTFTFNNKSLLQRLFLKMKSSLSEDLFTMDRENIKDIEFKVSYEDSKRGFLLKGLVGNDKLDVTIIDPDGTEKAIERITGIGNDTVEFGPITPMIDISPIEANSTSEADDELESRIAETMSNWDGETFSIYAEHKVAETFRLLLRLRERIDTDSFDVEITYTYYDYSLEESITEFDEDNEEDSYENDDFLSTSYSTTSMYGNNW